MSVVNVRAEWQRVNYTGLVQAVEFAAEITVELGMKLELRA